MKVSFIGQDIPMLLPSLLADLLFAGREGATIAIEERNPAMQDVLRRYGDSVIRKSGLPCTLVVSGQRKELLQGSDCVVYAGDCMAASRFHQDRQALGGQNEDDPGLSDQARVNGGLGGLLHTLRQGGQVLDLCEEMQTLCPHALVITLGQPVARTVEMFAMRGFQVYGLGASPVKGISGLEGVLAKAGRKVDSVQATMAGLPDFTFLLALQDAVSRDDLLPDIHQLAEENQFGRLPKRWLDWYGAVSVGDVTRHAEYLPAQPDYIPEENPAFGETVQQRKERILHMNTVGEKGAEDAEGAMAQLVLLSKAPATRPMKLALSILRGEDLTMEGVARKNGKTLPQLSPSAIIEAHLTLHKGQDVTPPISLPYPLAEVCGEVDEINRLTAKAAAGDRESLRYVIETDPALDGLDRLYCQELVMKLIEMHGDVLDRWSDEEEDE